MASLSSTKNNIYETYGIVKFNISDYTGDKVEYTWDFYLDNDYIGSSNKQDGTYTIRNLTPGVGYEVRGDCTINIGTEKIDPETGFGTGSYNWVTKLESDEINIYTHPGEWDWENFISQGDIIQKKLTASLVNKWVDHLAAWKSYNTQDNWSNAYDDYYDNRTENGYKVNSGDIIYLEWFNNCAKAHPHASTISHSNNEDIISVDRLCTLNFNGRINE